MFKEIVTKEQAEELDDESCVQGYLVGLKDQQPDYTQKDQAYWHGYYQRYLNGQVDCGKLSISEQQMKLARDWVKKSKLH